MPRLCIYHSVGTNLKDVCWGRGGECVNMVYLGHVYIMDHEVVHCSFEI